MPTLEQLKNIKSPSQKKIEGTFIPKPTKQNEIKKPITIRDDLSKAGLGNVFAGTKNVITRNKNDYQNSIKGKTMEENILFSKSPNDVRDILESIIIQEHVETLLENNPNEGFFKRHAGKIATGAGLLGLGAGAALASEDGSPFSTDSEDQPKNPAIATPKGNYIDEINKEIGNQAITKTTVDHSQPKGFLGNMWQGTKDAIHNTGKENAHGRQIGFANDLKNSIENPDTSMTGGQMLGTAATGLALAGAGVAASSKGRSAVKQGYRSINPEYRKAYSLHKQTMQNRARKA